MERDKRGQTAWGQTCNWHSVMACRVYADFLLCVCVCLCRKWRSSFFNAFYGFINIGSLVSLGRSS